MRARRQLVELLSLRPVEERLQRLGQPGFAQGIQTRLACEGRLQPLVGARREGLVGKIGKPKFRHPRAQAADALAPLLQAIGPRQRVDAEVGDGVGQCFGGQGRIDPAGWFRFQDDLVEAHFAPRLQAPAPADPSGRNRVRRSVPGNPCAAAFRRAARRVAPASRGRRNAIRWPRSTARRTTRCHRRFAPCARSPAGSVAGRRDAGARSVPETHAAADRRAECAGAEAGGWRSQRRRRRHCWLACVDRRQCAAVGDRRCATGAECRQRLPARRPVVAAIALARDRVLRPARPGRRPARVPRHRCPTAAWPPAADGCRAPACACQGR